MFNIKVTKQTNIASSSWAHDRNVSSMCHQYVAPLIVVILLAGLGADARALCAPGRRQSGLPSARPQAVL